MPLRHHPLSKSLVSVPSRPDSRAKLAERRLGIYFDRICITVVGDNIAYRCNITVTLLPLRLAVKNVQFTSPFRSTTAIALGWLPKTNRC